MGIINKFYLLHTRSEVLIKRALQKALECHKNELRRLEIVDSIPNPLRLANSVCYLIDNGSCQSSNLEEGNQVFDIVALKNPESLEQLKSVAKSISECLTEGEILDDLESRTTITHISVEPMRRLKTMTGSSIHISYKTECK